jgi:hypothetical protein
MRKLHVFLLVGFLAGIAGISGCNIINPEEPLPTYIHIDSFGFDNSYPRGSTSRNITHVWAYLDNQPIGNFDLPVTFPAIVTKNSILTVIPGIDFDGLRGYPVTYPMYNSDTLSVSPQPGVTVDWQPTTSYVSGSSLVYNETFDQPVRLKFTKRTGDTDIERTTSDVFEGGGSGFFRLEQSRNQDSVTILSDSMSLTVGRAAYIEVDYKGDAPLAVGMRAYLNDGTIYEQYLITLRERTDWKKFYVGVREFVAEHQGPRYQILLGTSRPSAQASATVGIDNVKMVSF